MVQHWIQLPTLAGSISFTSIITRFCQNALLLNNFNDFITEPRIMLTTEHFIKANIISGGPNNTLEFKFRNSEARVNLPCPELKLYGATH